MSTKEKKPLIIYDHAWKNFDQHCPPASIPCWIKLANNNIVLAYYKNNDDGTQGWWAVTYTSGTGTFFVSRTHAYVVNGAQWQPCTMLE